MNAKEFKSVVKYTLEDNDFFYKRGTYYQESNELIACIDLQKSNFEA